MPFGTLEPNTSGNLFLRSINSEASDGHSWAARLELDDIPNLKLIIHSRKG